MCAQTSDFLLQAEAKDWGGGGRVISHTGRAGIKAQQTKRGMKQYNAF